MTSPGAKLPDYNVPKDTVVAIFAEGKQHAIAVGLTSMSTVRSGDCILIIKHTNTDHWIYYW